MIDLAKNYGVHENILFYGDHDQDNIVYYLPDEVSLSKTGPVGSRDYELMLQLFSEGQVVHGDLNQLEKTMGGLMSLGIQCSVTPSRLETALQKVIEERRLPPNTVAALPTWKSGRVDLMILDSTTQDEDTIGGESFVDGIIGSKSPSLQTSDLKSVFNVRLDSRGATLVNAALNGERGHVAGVLYDLKFPAIRPALDLRIWADLSRCYQTVSHSLGIKAEFTYYVKFSLGADLEWVTRKMEENGDLRIEVLSQVTNPEMKKLVDETVRETKEKILKELFRPMVNPGVEGIQPISLGLEEAIPKVGVAYKFKKVKGVQSKIIDLDFRERSATIMTHNPQAHLWTFGQQVGSKLSEYTQVITFSDLWRKHQLKVSALHNFEAEDNDLVAASLLLWRKKDGIAEEGNGSGVFAKPSNAQPLSSFTFSKDDKDPRTISWTTDADEEEGFYYQTRFVFDNLNGEIDSPLEIVTNPQLSYSRELPIILNGETMNRIVNIQAGNLDFSKIQSVDVLLGLQNQDGDLIEQQHIVLKEDKPQAKWHFRRPLNNEVFLTEKREYHFKENLPSIETNQRFLMDDEVIINGPLKLGGRTIIPVLAGSTENLLKIIVELSYHPPGVSNPVHKTILGTGPEFKLEDIQIQGIEHDLPINYKASDILISGQQRDVVEGVLEDQALIIDLKQINQEGIEIFWTGKSPENEDLKWLKVEVARQTEGDMILIEELKYEGSDIPEKRILELDISHPLFYKITKRTFGGERSKQDWQRIVGNTITINP